MVSTATAAITLDKDAFAEMVTQEKLTTTVAGGYKYAGKQGKNGWTLYRTFEGWDSVPVSVGATTNPAAGANAAAVTVTAGKRWLLYGVFQQIVFSADVQNRFPYFQVAHDGTNVSFYVALGTCVAGETVNISLQPGVPYNDASSSGWIHAPFPIGGIEVPAGATFQLITNNIHANDDGAALRYFYKEVDA